MQFVYLFLSLFLGRKNPLYFLLFAFALASGPGAFIDTRYNLGMNFFLIDHADKMISAFYLFVIFLYCKFKYNITNAFNNTFNIYSTYIIILIIITLFDSFFKYSAVNTCGSFLQMLFGFYAIRYIFLCATKENFYNFINMMIFVTSIQCILFILNSSHILNIFDESMLYQDINYGGESFTRDFATLPIFGFIFFLISFANIFYKIKDIKLLNSLFLVGLYPIVTLFSFTRSIIGPLVIESLLIAVISIFIKPKNRSSSLRPKVILVVLIGLVYYLITSYMGTQISFMQSRIEDNTMYYRNQNMSDAIAYLKMNDGLLFGSGMNHVAYSFMGRHGSWLADTTIPPLLIFSGIIGCILYYLLYFYYFIKLIPLFLKKRTSLLIAFVIYIVFSTLGSFFVGGNRWGTPLFFIYLSIASYFLTIYNDEE